MKLKYKGPNGIGLIQVPDDGSMGNVFDELATKAGVRIQAIKYGMPMAMKTVDSSQRNEPAASFKLNGESVIIVPEEISLPLGSTRSSKTPSIVCSDQADDAGSVLVVWPERDGTMVLRVMPSDNSCLFTAFGGALPQQIAPQKLRQMMAAYIQEHSEVYTEAVLGSHPDVYCVGILDPDRWGGGIELSILSTIFDVQISTFDVQSRNAIHFGEDKAQRCILVYSGIHYDRVAFSYSDYPHTHPNLPPDLDRSLWPSSDTEVLEKAQDLVDQLNKAHYYTDVGGIVLKCDTPGCNWLGAGQASGQEHANQTGHTALSEIEDNER